MQHASDAFDRDAHQRSVLACMCLFMSSDARLLRHRGEHRSCTACARESACRLRSSDPSAAQELQLDVVYGDTDSVFVNTKTQDYRQAMQAAQQIKARMRQPASLGSRASASGLWSRVGTSGGPALGEPAGEGGTCAQTLGEARCMGSLRDWNVPTSGAQEPGKRTNRANRSSLDARRRRHIVRNYNDRFRKLDNVDDCNATKAQRHSEEEEEDDEVTRAHSNNDCESKRTRGVLNFSRRQARLWPELSRGRNRIWSDFSRI